MRSSRPLPSESSRSRHPPAGEAGEVRLIGGRWKRSKLTVLARPGLRPTPDRVRETLFNWLGQSLEGWAVLDPFAGSGALGFEAASRGASQVCLVEIDAGLVDALQSVKVRLDAQAVQVQRAEALAWMMASSPDRFDLILLDPPFDADLFVAALDRALPLLRRDGWIYLEADRDFSDADLAVRGLQVRRRGRAGMVHFHLLERRAVSVSDYTAASSATP